MIRPRPLLLAVLLAGCPAAPSTPAPTPVVPDPGQAHGPAPRLVVLFVIDQLPEWAFEQKRGTLTGGFDRLLREGEWHTGQHPGGATLTAPGHALLGTGEPTYHSGIVANEWWDRGSETLVKSVQAADSTTSAAWLRVPGLGDAMAAANTGAKAVSVSLKDRAAILTLGHAGTPIWYDHKAVAWTSLAPPAWLAEHNRAHPITAHLNDVWTPLDPARLATLSGTIDAQPGEVGEKGFGPTFPHALAQTKDPADAIFAAPVGNQIVLETALAAIDGEHLGADAVPDLLVLSLSAHDYVGHGWGHESWESWDMVMRLDQQLGDFLAGLDAKVGAGKWAMLLTSDHGASPLPERVGGGRIAYEQVQDAANKAASVELGPGAWVPLVKAPTIYLTAAARAKPPKELATAIKKIVYALRSFPGLGTVEKTADFAGHCETRTGVAFLLCVSIDPERSGEVMFFPRHGWIMEEADERLATAHGSLEPYDRLVPVIMLPPGRTPHAPLAKADGTTVQMVRIATVLAGWLNVAPPSSLPREPVAGPSPR